MGWLFFCILLPYVCMKLVVLLKIFISGAEQNIKQHHRKIAVKISMSSVVFQSNMTVWGQTDLWMVSNQPERPAGSDGRDRTSHLRLWSMLNSFVSFCPTIVLILAWILKLTLSSKVAQFFYMCWTMGAFHWFNESVEVLVVLPR